MLGILFCRYEIVTAVQNERVIIVAGDTGCGKSTQVPQYLHEAGFQNIGNKSTNLKIFKSVYLFFCPNRNDLSSFAMTIRIFFLDVIT